MNNKQQHMEKKYLDNAVNSHHKEIRCGVAKHGYKEHLDILVNDPESVVRWVVACYGQMEHVNILLKDKDSTVREAAKNRRKHLKKERWYYYPEKAIGWAIVVGSILGIGLIVSAILANQTFGQRCSAMGLDKGSVKWETCIQELQRKD